MGLHIGQLLGPPHRWFGHGSLGIAVPHPFLRGYFSRSTRGHSPYWLILCSTVKGCLPPRSVFEVGQNRGETVVCWTREGRRQAAKFYQAVVYKRPKWAFWRSMMGFQILNQPCSCVHHVGHNADRHRGRTTSARFFGVIFQLHFCVTCVKKYKA